MRHSRFPRRRPAALLAAALLITLLAPAAALASPWRGIGVTLYDLAFDKTPTLVVFGSLADDVELPAVVELPIPAGSTIGWVGEISGQDTSLDTVAEFTVRPEDGYDVLEITVTRARAVQAELVPPEGWVDRTEASLGLTMSWTAHEDTPGVRLGFEIPDTAHAEELAPDRALRERTRAGVLYSVETTPVAAGETLTLDALVLPGPDPLLPPEETEAATGTPDAATLETASPEPIAAQADARSLPVVPILAGIVAVLLAVLALVVTRSRRQG